MKKEELVGGAVEVDPSKQVAIPRLDLAYSTGGREEYRSSYRLVAAALAIALAIALATWWFWLRDADVDLTAEVRVVAPTAPAGDAEATGGITGSGPEVAETGDAGEVHADKPEEEAINPFEPLVVVRLEGGEVSGNMGRLLEATRERFPAIRHTVQSGESLCRILAKQYDLRDRRLRCSYELQDAIRKMNPDVDLVNLNPEDKVLLPQADFKEYSFVKYLDVAYKEEKKELENLEKHWSYLIREKTVRPGSSLVKLDMRGFQLEVPVADHGAAESLASSLYAMPESNNMLIYASEADAAERQQFSRFEPVAASRYPQILGTGDWKPGHEGWYALDSRLGQKLGHEAFACQQVCGQKAVVGETIDRSRCAEIVLIDSEETVENTEIAEAMVRDPEDRFHPGVGECRILRPTPPEEGRPQPAVDKPQAPADTYQVLRPSQYDEKKSHPVHLAGIMVSQANGTGFAGLSPCSHLHGFNSSLQAQDGYRRSDAKLAAHFDRHYHEGSPLQVFVYTGEFDPYAAKLLDGEGFLMHREWRTDKHVAAKAIERLPLLLVAAVGQPKRGESIREIRDRTALAPQNLGYLANVILVTACEDCSARGARLWPKAHYSRPGHERQSYVHVAAPGGKGVPAVIGDGKIATMQGTSQATAFVGGVVASMVNCYSGYYTRPETVKLRLLLTSAPVLRGEDSERVAGGIVDPHAARLDPTRDWLKRAGKDHYEEVKVKRWCFSGMELEDPNTREQRWSVPRPTTVRRFVHVPDHDGAGESAGAVFYLVRERIDNRNQRTEIRKFGPGRWTGTAPLVEIGNGASREVLSFDRVGDLILSDNVETVSKSACRRAS